MEKNKIILIAIAVLVIALLAVGAYLVTTNSHNASVNNIQTTLLLEIIHQDTTIIPTIRLQGYITLKPIHT